MCISRRVRAAHEAGVAAIVAVALCMNRHRFQDIPRDLHTQGGITNHYLPTTQDTRKRLLLATTIFSVACTLFKKTSA